VSSLGAETSWCSSDARAELLRECPAAAIDEVLCDLSSLAAVRVAAAEIAERGAVDALVHCAGVFAGARRVTADGYELMVATNHLAPTLLTLLLGPVLSAARAARVVFVTTPFRSPLPLEDPMSQRSFSSLHVFAMSKAMNLSFACELAQRWRGAVSVFAADPGRTRSGLLREAPLSLRLAMAALAGAPEATRAPIVTAATSEAMTRKTGLYIGHRRADTLVATVPDEEARRRLWELSVALVGTLPPAMVAVA
jgi:NAD(P)-dependent dehydrogenase (short-subunit alcohol dehydrogenase family)